MTSTDETPPELRPDTGAAIKFLKLYAPEGPWLLTKIVPDGRIDTATFGPSSIEECRRWIDIDLGERNFYFSVNPTINDLKIKAKKTDIRAVQWLHVDIDPSPDEERHGGFDRERERIAAAIEAFPVPPTLVIDSGGGFQAFWKLEDEFTIDGDESKAPEIEAYNIQLANEFRADNCHNIDRIMRLPGTWNIPTKRKKAKGRKPAVASVVRFDPSLAYPLGRFTPAVVVQSGAAKNESRPALALDTGNVRRIDIEELDKWKVPGDVVQTIVQGCDPDHPTRWPSRSEALFYVVCALNRNGVPDEIIYSIITDPDLKISASILDKSRPDKEATRQIQRAHEKNEAEWLLELNDEYAFIKDFHGQPRIIYESEVPFGRNQTRIKLNVISENGFRSILRPVKIDIKLTDNKTTKKPVSELWLNHPKRRFYRCVALMPKQGADDVYNLWRGFKVPALSGNGHEPLLEHTYENICCRNDEHYNYLINWMARAVQMPDCPGETAVVMKGGMGVGKSFLAKTMVALFGRHGRTVSDGKHLTGNFNAHLRDCIFLFSDEAFFAGDKAQLGNLKNLITGDTITVEPKGVDAEEAPNFLHIMMASNEAWVVPADIGERRFFVLDVGDKRQGDTPYFRNIQDQLDAGGLGNFLHFLLNRDITNFNVRHAPKTRGLAIQQGQTLKDFAAFVFDFLITNRVPASADRDGPAPVPFIESKPLRDEVNEWLKGKPGGHHVTFHKMNELMEKLGCPSHREAGGKRRYGYEWDSVKMRRRWDKVMFKVHDWPTGEAIQEECPF